MNRHQMIESKNRFQVSRKPVAFTLIELLVVIDGHVTHSTAKPAFDRTKYWDFDDHLSAANPGNNITKLRSILSLLRP